MLTHTHLTRSVGIATIILGVAKDLKLAVVAEGVETQEQMQILMGSPVTWCKVTIYPTQYLLTRSRTWRERNSRRVRSIGRLRARLISREQCIEIRIERLWIA